MFSPLQKFFYAEGSCRHSFAARPFRLHPPGCLLVVRNILIYAFRVSAFCLPSACEIRVSGVQKISTVARVSIRRSSLRSEVCEVESFCMIRRFAAQYRPKNACNKHVLLPYSVVRVEGSCGPGFVARQVWLHPSGILLAFRNNLIYVFPSFDIASRRFSFFFFLVFVFPTGCVRVNSSVGDGLGGFRLLLTSGCSLSYSVYRQVRVVFVYFTPEADSPFEI